MLLGSISANILSKFCIFLVLHIIFVVRLDIVSLYDQQTRTCPYVAKKQMLFILIYHIHASFM